jgi:uncharacterized membrane protein
MTETQSVHAGRRYRQLMYGVIVLGVVSLFVSVRVNQYLAGLVVYAAAVVAAFGLYFYVRYSDSLAIADERERTLERRASHLTVQLLGFGSLFAFVALFILDATGRPSIGPTVETLLYTYTVFWVTWGVLRLWLKYRS